MKNIQEPDIPLTVVNRKLTENERSILMAAIEKNKKQLKNKLQKTVLKSKPQKKSK